MSLSQPDVERRLLPRWLVSGDAILSGELAGTTLIEREPLEGAHFEERKLEWERDPSIEVAAELVASAIVLNRTVEVERAAQMLANESNISYSLRDLARHALGDSPPNRAGTRSTGRPGRLDPAPFYAGVSTLRRHVRQHPRNAYAWIDQARLYTVLGQTPNASRAIQTALAIAPADRFVLRAAARYFVHIDQAEVAQQLLVRSAATRTDPWLIAAEIAVSQVAKRPSRTATIGRRALERGDWSPHSSSELAGALATLLLEDGSATKARQLFRTSLAEPTENAVAQAQWATQRTAGLVVPQALLQLPTTYEARALRERVDGSWDAAIESSWKWAEYEPTSSRPLLMGSYIAGVAHGDGQTVLDFANRGLYAEPRNALFLNNKAVGLAYLGRVAESAEIMKQIIVEDSPLISQPALYATLGLLNFRTGDVETGRALYGKAANHGYTKRDPGVRILAMWHLALEEARAATDQATAAIERAERGSKDLKFAEIEALRLRVKKMRAAGKNAR